MLINKDAKPNTNSEIESYIFHGFYRNGIRDSDANKRWRQPVKVSPQHMALGRISPLGEEHRRTGCCPDLHQYLNGQHSFQKK